MDRTNHIVYVITFFFCLFSSSITASSLRLFVGFSGGYGEMTDTYQNTGTGGIIRFAFGSLMHLNSKFDMGEQIGFQTSSQFRLGNQITNLLG